MQSYIEVRSSDGVNAGNIRDHVDSCICLATVMISNVPSETDSASEDKTFSWFLKK